MVEARAGVEPTYTDLHRRYVQINLYKSTSYAVFFDRVTKRVIRISTPHPATELSV